MNTQIPNFVAKDNKINPDTLRLGLFLAAIMYGVFGFLDMYMMPSNYTDGWLVRYAFIMPFILFTYVLTYYKSSYKYGNIILFTLLTLGQIGIIILIGISSPEDMAFTNYYAGLILVILWASFVFSLSFYTTVYIALSTIVFYNITALFIQGYIYVTADSDKLLVLLNNNFFLISASVLVVIGAYQLEKRAKENRIIHDELINDKRELKIAKEKAEESDRLKSAFLANMSHEIRTPMNGILGFSELLKTPNLTGEKQQEYVNIIEKGGERMLNIINDIISISKIESGEIDIYVIDMNINDLIKYIYTFFIHQVEEKGIQLSYNNSLSYNAAIVKTDKEKIYAVLTNLVKNAIKFTDEGSIEFGCSKKDGFIEFYVKDSGIGISEDRQDAIFERFIQVDIADKNAYQGAGLGLSISKAYVEILGGKIWVESNTDNFNRETLSETKNVGSTFYFTVPCENEIEEDNSEKIIISPSLNNEQISKLKILIVEDDEISEELITILLKDIRKEILYARTGIEAVEACQNNLDIDLVLMDIQMPEMDGYTATREIRKFNSDVVIIAQTAYAMEGDDEKVYEAGCNDYIPKPINSEELMNKICTHMTLKLKDNC